MKSRLFAGWWQVLVALVIQAIGSTSVFTAYSIFAVPFKAEFDPSNMVLMLGITATVLVSGILSPSLGSAIDRYSVRNLMLYGAILMLIGFFLMSYTTSMNQVLVIYALLLSPSGVLLGPIAASALLARWFVRRRGLAISIAACGSAIGGLFIPPLLQTLFDLFEWRDGLRIYTIGIAVLMLPIIAFLTINRPQDKNLNPDGDATDLDTDHTTSTTSTTLPFNPMKTLTFWGISLTMGAIFFGTTGLISNMLPVVMEKGVEATLGALLISSYSAASLGGRILCAAIADRLDLRWTLMGMVMLLAVAMFTFAQGTSYTLLSVASILIGLSGGAATPVWSLILAKVYGANNMGTVMGRMALIIMPFSLCAAPVFGYVYDRTGSYSSTFTGYLVLLAGVLLLLTQVKVQPAALELKPQTAPST